MSAPLPPADIKNRHPDTVSIAKGTICHRFFATAREPLFFDRGTSGRLNAPDGRFGVIYLAENRDGAFAETFLRVPGRTLLPPDLLSQKAYVAFRMTRDLTLIKLAGPGLAKVGATAEITHGPLPYDVPQRWSGELYDHPHNFDGIAYTARHDDEQLCYAIFDRANDAFEESARDPRLDSAWFFQLMDRYDVGLAPA